MTLETNRPPTRPRGTAPLAGAVRTLLVAPLLLLAATASADRERGLPVAETSSGVSAPALAPAPAPAPSYSAPAPRSAPSSDGYRGSSSPSERAPSRGSSGSGGDVSRGPSRAGSRDSSGYTGGRGRSYVGGGSRGPIAHRNPRPHRRYHAPSIRWGTSWWWGGPWDWWWWGGGWGPNRGWGGVVVIDDETSVFFPGRYARVDTDVSPEAAEVFLDGTYIGAADDFDGLPGFLYLEPGRYRLEFRHPSYETLVKELQVRRGQEVRLGDDMKLLAGKSRMGSFDPEHRGTPLGRVFGKPDREDRGRDRTGRFEARDRTEPRKGADVEDREDLEDRDDDLEELDELDADDDPDEDLPPPARPAPDARPSPPAAPRPPADEAAPLERGRLRFDVEPADAAVYVDDRYVGTGEELGGLARGFPVRAGKHTVTVVRPGYAAKTMDVEAKPGAAIDVVIELDK